MRVAGMMRVKNEARWIERCVRSILPLCEQIFILDDHSTDGTADICRAIPCTTVLDSPFTGLDEARDKNWLLEQTLTGKPDWIIAIDGDEMLAPASMEPLRCAMLGNATCLSLRVLYLWDGEDQVRVDGVYGDFHRESVFRPDGSRFELAGAGPNFHCGNVPARIRQKRRVMNDVALLHFGYLHREDRARKFHWYNQADPGNAREDGYRHMVIGDLFPPESKFMHGGPLQLQALV